MPLNLVAVHPTHHLSHLLPAQIQADIDRSQAELNNEIKGQLRLQPSQTNAVSDLNAAVDNAQASIDGLIVAAERQPFIAAYTDLKACVCCALGHQLLTQWICVTVAGDYLNLLKFSQSCCHQRATFPVARAFHHLCQPPHRHITHRFASASFSRGFLFCRQPLG